jgi:4-alpha-glucanotransferase
MVNRSTGVLLHPTSLPGKQGIGVFDASVIRFLDFLEAAAVRSWQICPLGPTGYGDSPYQCFSAFAGNPYLIDLQQLVDKGLLTAAEIKPLEALPRDKVDYGWLYVTKWPILKKAYERYLEQGKPTIGSEGFDAFRAARAQWIDAFGYFRALKDFYQGKPWWEWPTAQRNFASASRASLRSDLAHEIEAHQFYQYVFFAQWTEVRKEAKKRGIRIIGDVPIFVAGDSADAWQNPELFELDQDGLPLAVAGVPPDYFSEDGQLWGNPLYHWEKHKEDGYAWWIHRMSACFDLCDVVRIDHFRGFDAYWRVPYPAANARVGTWVPGPGLDFFRAVQAQFPDAKIIAEDLGVLTPSVIKLRDDTGLPGMAILQFAFGGGAENAYLPHNLMQNSVVYPGTHDNDTSLGWYESADEKSKDHVRRYFRITGKEIGWDLIRASYQATSKMAVISFQDFLSLGSEGRFNTPGKGEGNWQWRYTDEQLDQLMKNGSAAYLASLAELYGRFPTTRTPPA